MSLVKLLKRLRGKAQAPLPLEPVEPSRPTPEPQARLVKRVKPRVVRQKRVQNALKARMSDLSR